MVINYSTLKFMYQKGVVKNIPCSYVRMYEKIFT